MASVDTDALVWPCAIHIVTGLVSLYPGSHSWGIEILRAGQTLSATTYGNSMWPSIRGGDRILVKQVPPYALRIGDVIVYEDGRKVVAHRLIRKGRQGTEARFTVKGDCIQRPDPLLAPASVAGRVVAVERGQRHLDLDSPWRRLWALAVVLLGAQLPTLLGLWRVGSFRKLATPERMAAEGDEA